MQALEESHSWKGEGNQVAAPDVLGTATVFWGSLRNKGGKMMNCNRWVALGAAFLVGSFLLLSSACGTNSTGAGGSENAGLAGTPTRVTVLTLHFKCRENPAGGFYVNASQGRVCVQTAPGAALTITVSFCNGAPDPSNELKGTVYANSEGYYEWIWKPRPDCKTAHIWKGDAVVKATLGGQSINATASFFGD